ncbi:phosphoribosylglycinamide formyltransferase [Sulfurifustis variabilis]|uniref:Phosphoribosylglycinamide formyltransferase n=1 Tax=Sulfurifustis variabilis TaxID=1675686 RepID=A0A1B4V6A1_9GAMM|nr:phosphoribosylglycinamide formyltransferase [Sulfurifustis variabilis]BAU49050.1 phosphoribosylglycinamide formyltransferase [Sulfurifustis variabilis]
MAARARCRLVVLISGRGSNLQAIIDAVRAGQVPAEIAAVVSNRPDAAGLSRAREAGLPVEAVDHRAYASREEFDRALQERIDRHRPDLVVLAGFLRILGTRFIEHYEGRLVNIHPSLLPAFPGLDTHARALAAGVRRHGASVHFVTNEVDCGPLIVQASVPVLPGDTPASLAERVLSEEHRIYPLAIRWFAEGRLSIKDGRVLLDGARRPEQGLDIPPPEE